MIPPIHQLVRWVFMCLMGPLFLLRIFSLWRRPLPKPAGQDPHRIFSFRPENLTGSSISLSGNLPTTTPWENFLFYFGISYFTISWIPWSNTLPLRPSKPKMPTVDLFLMSILDFRLSRIQELRYHATLLLDFWNPETRITKILKLWNSMSPRCFTNSTGSLLSFHVLPPLRFRFSPLLCLNLSPSILSKPWILKFWKLLWSTLMRILSDFRYLMCQDPNLQLGLPKSETPKWSDGPKNLDQWLMLI